MKNTLLKKNLEVIKMVSIPGFSKTADDAIKEIEWLEKKLDSIRDAIHLADMAANIEKKIAELFT